MTNESYCLFFLVVLGISVPSAYATITLNGTIFTYGQYNMTETHPITVEAASVNSSGVLLQKTTEAPRLYNYSRTSHTGTMFDITGYSNSIFFVKPLSIINDTRGNVSGAKIHHLQLDGTNSTFFFTGAFNYFLAGASSKINVFFFGVPGAGGDALISAVVPCFLNYSAGAEMWKNCGVTQDYLQFMLLPWEWITGGNFSLLFVSLFTMFTYIKYHKAVYPILIGSLFLPISYFIFPDTFLSWAFILAYVAIGFIIVYAILKQSKEY